MFRSYIMALTDVAVRQARATGQRLYPPCLGVSVDSMGSEAPSIPLSPVLATPVKRLSAVPAQPELESPAEVVSDFQRERMEMLDLRGSPPSAGVSVCQAGRQIPRPDQSGDQGWQAADAEHGQPWSTDSRMAARSIQERTGAGGVPAAPDIDDGLFQGSRHSIIAC